MKALTPFMKILPSDLIISQQPYFLDAVTLGLDSSRCTWEGHRLSVYSSHLDRLPRWNDSYLDLRGGAGIREIVGCVVRNLCFNHLTFGKKSSLEPSIHSCSMQVMMQEMVWICDSKDGRYLAKICSRVSTSYNQKRQRAWGKGRTSKQR